MRGLMRILIMFGPMIFRQIQKMQRNKARQQPTQYPDRQIPRNRNSNRDRPDHRSNRDSVDNRRSDRGRQREDRGEYVEYKDLNKELGRPSPEEKAFDLSEEEIMLDKEDLRHFDRKPTYPDSKSIEEELDELKEKPMIQEAKKKQSDLDLKDLFLDEEDIAD